MCLLIHTYIFLKHAHLLTMGMSEEYTLYPQSISKYRMMSTEGTEKQQDCKGKCGKTIYRMLDCCSLYCRNINTLNLYTFAESLPSSLPISLSMFTNLQSKTPDTYLCLFVCVGYKIIMACIQCQTLLN